MTHHTRRLTPAPLSLALAAVLSAFAATATASSPDPQTTADQTAPDQAGDAPDAKRLDSVMVTGSRIGRVGFDSLEPATVVGAEYIQGYGFTNIADALFIQPSFGAGATSRGDQSGYGAGVNFIGRFGLGSNRQLTLVNGRRFVTSNPPTVFGPSGGGTQVDLNVIPTILIDQVETIGVGGAPTYGSDAISGVSNLILRKNFDGAEVRMGYGLTDRGDNERFNYSALLGSNFGGGRGNITIALDADNSQGVLGTARRFYRDAYSTRANPSASAIANFQPGRTPANDGRVNPGIGFNTGPNDGIPGRVLIRNRRISDMTWGGLLFPSDAGTVRDASGQLRGFGANEDQFVQFDRNGDLVNYNPGTNFGISDASGGDGVNLQETTQIISDLDRKTVFALGNYDFTDQVSGFFEASFYTSTARELVDQNVYNATGFGVGSVDGSGDQSGSLNFNINNPFLTEQNRQTLQNLGVEDFVLSRSSRDLVQNQSSTDTNLWRAVVGLQGSFDAAGRGFNWEASVNHGEGNFDYYNDNLIQQNFINAINVTRNSAGQIVCDSSAAGTTVDPNCAPLNLFGEGVASRAARNYVIAPTHAEAQMKQTVFNANITGAIIDLPGGELRFNAGYERRREEGSFTPSTFERLGQGRSVPIAAASGEFTTNEYFGEILAPLVNPDAGIPGLHRLDLTGKIRRVENTVNGWFSAYTYGLQYEPFQGVQLRGNKTRSFRAPSIAELYTSQQPAYYFIPEPCSAAQIGSGPRPGVRARNCQAFFDFYTNADPASFEEAPSSQLGSVSGNTRLQNEQAESWTAGIVLQPEWVKGLRIAADWYDIQITNSVTTLSEEDITSGCFDSDTFNANDVPNANNFCSLITRNPQTGVANSIRTEYTNGPYTNFRGWTAEVNYRFDLADVDWGKGIVDLSFYGYFPKTLESAAAPGIPPDEAVGEIDNPKRQFQWNARYMTSHWNLGLSANYSSSVVYDLTDTVETRAPLGVPSYTSYDANVGYAFDTNTSVNLAALNVTDKLVAFPNVYDGLGRRYMFTLNHRF
ncbi:TonB-dependent receptor domain-containing protein [Xanthomonas campestris]|jgi:outer membrane receptor protein involved in Fe transport|uniref:TonB-dependent receptor domain-containing protein n=1 Tax=Xanthomonas campestris TaxID=339 RepID=UPI0005E702B5|nr:TonB-dependent receptor [Xanthomonas campestris]MCC5050798.1 TonB-dependent receptor [Xanthomonas campestris pv. aberrans]MDM7670574.1 TonB-dependent receptor [Xanthomonas campestris pv. campestris]MDM7675687.1 TonB-dependent receptor [Xanthomonas campestris pv. campestris]MDM7678117.1 TonB-dependent receptor [Xanthomonas campestris pv. campestris]MDM7682045.1 TonB-dependent receptor [Xanthomonas campestris pv. campestris]